MVRIVTHFPTAVIRPARWVWSCRSSRAHSKTTGFTERYGQTTPESCKNSGGEAWLWLLAWTPPLVVYGRDSGRVFVGSCSSPALGSCPSPAMWRRQKPWKKNGAWTGRVGDWVAARDWPCRKIKATSDKSRCHMAPPGWSKIDFSLSTISKITPNSSLFCHLTPQIFYNLSRIALWPPI